MKVNKILTCFALIGLVQFGYSDKLNYEFYYAQGINKVKFDHSSAGNGQSDSAGGKLTVSTNNKDNRYIVTVETNILTNKNKIADPSARLADDYANKFIQSDNNVHHLIQNKSTTITSPTNLDFWTQGTLYINDEIVASDFTFAHNNEKMTGNNNWWIATNSGNIYEPNMSLELHNNDYTKYYCIQQYKNSNFEVLVGLGKCDNTSTVPYDWTKLQDEKLQFHYNFDSKKTQSNITKIEFVYNGNHNALHKGADYLKSVDSKNNDKGLQIIVNAKLDGEGVTAASFSDKFNKETTLTLNTNSTKINKSPDNLNFWVEGSLYIDGHLIADDFTIGEEDLLISRKWWIGSKHGQSYIDNNDGIPKMNLNGYCFMVKNMKSNSFSADYDKTLYVYKGQCPSQHKDVTKARAV